MEQKSTYSIILFDGVCNYCNNSVNRFIRNDHHNHFKFAPLQSEKGKSLQEELNISKGLDSIILIEGNVVYAKATAVLKIFKHLKGIYPLFYPFIIVPRPIRDFFYDTFAKNRYKWYGKREQCMVPTAEVKERFVL